jgi:ABC-2 type transport system ATP-binding protein
MSAALEAIDLDKHYGRRRALTGCTLRVPPGHVVGLVGPNGAGKSTLLQLAVGLLRPTAGTISVLGRRPGSDRAQLGRVGYVAQDAPVYARLSVGDHLRLGAKLNPRWDDRLANERVATLGLDREQHAGRLSGGQRAQLALTLAIAKRPELLVLDEPVASLDPLARREFMQGLMEHIAEHRTSVILSSHLVGDLERVCDYVVVLASSRVQIAGELDELLGTHYRMTGPPGDPAATPAAPDVIQVRHTERQSSAIVRSTVPVDAPGWEVEPLDLEDVVLAYMSRAAGTSAAQREPAAELSR